MHKTRRRRAPGPRRSRTTFDPQTARWLLRTLARSTRSAYDLELLGNLGVRVTTPGAEATPDPAALRAAIVSRLAKLEASVAAPSLAGTNAALLGRTLGLSQTEIELLALTIAFEAEEALGACFGALRARNLGDTAKHLAAVLGLRARDVAHALRRDGALRELHLVHLTRADRAEIGPLQLGHAVSTVLLQPLAHERDLLGHFVDELPRASLGLHDYSHIARDVELLQRLLAAALRARETGVNVLLHGAPGTGKTELARALAAATGAKLAAVKLADGSDDLLDGSERLENHALCQRMLRGQHDLLLLFDEAEDAFPCGSWLTQARSGRHKAWTNRLLEQNPIPTLWISNLIDHIDRAFVRRFDFVLELAAPPRSVRRRVLDRHLEPFALQPSALEALADREQLSPGHVQRAARVLRLLERQGSGERQAEADLTRVLDANLRAYAGPAKPRSRAELSYDLSLLATDTDPLRLVQGLKAAAGATLCFYGPPGTGKTALAHHIARELDRPLCEYRASDLLSAWVGETEQNIARMFQRAAADGGVLLLDEADSMLAERSRARSSWEVTQVNEMLAQMEHFDGTFICSTNLMEHLDRAALRRFAIKVRFDFLRAPQIERLFRSLVADADVHEAVRDASRLPRLTPGDFAAVVRKLRLLGITPSSSELLRALREELTHKQERGAAIGFGPNLTR